MVVSSNSFGDSSVTQEIVGCVCNNKIASISMFLFVAAKIRLVTRSRAEYSYSYEEFRQEVEALFSSFNILNAETRDKIMNFIDKYIVGLECKIEDTTTRTKNEDGSVFTIKGKKLTQKPCGAMGLFDAYVLSQAKKIVDYIPAIAGLYVLVNDPYKTFSVAANKVNAISDKPSSH
jgi:hypothetical protein